MCLAVPGQLLSVEGEDEFTRTGRISFGGVVKQVNLAYVPDARVGDYLLVHAGFAISIIDAGEAAKTLAYLAQLGADELL